MLARVYASGSTLVVISPSRLLYELLKEVKSIICIDDKGERRRLDVVSVEYRGGKLYFLVRQRKVRCRTIELPVQVMNVSS